MKVSSLLQLNMVLLGGSRGTFHILLDLAGHLHSLFEGNNHCLTPLVAASQLCSGEVRVENGKCSFLFHL